MAETLKPCPFCGGEAHELVGKADDGGRKYKIGCYDPDCAGSAFEATVFFYEEDAVAAWNRRAERTCRVRKLSALRADPTSPMHGTMTGYRYGCRCELCRAARHEYHVSHYEGRGAA